MAASQRLIECWKYVRFDKIVICNGVVRVIGCFRSCKCPPIRYYVFLKDDFLLVLIRRQNTCQTPLFQATTFFF